MIDVDLSLAASDLEPSLARMWSISGDKIKNLIRSYPHETGSPVFTVEGRYTAQGWTEWTQGFLYGWAILQYDATGDEDALELGRVGTRDHMAPHLTHVGVHDHGFNNLSTYGNLWRLATEGRIGAEAGELDLWELAIKVSGAVQAARWTDTFDGGGFIYSFNGPHSLFVDTLRTIRVLSLAHVLGHSLMGENDRRISLLDRSVSHALKTAEYNVFYGEQRDIYDVSGRVAHEAIFNTNDGRFRCVNTQQGYSGFTTWTRGLAWAMCGFAEQLEFLAALATASDNGPSPEMQQKLLRAATAVCDYYLESTPPDGIPYWDTGAPGLARLEAPFDRPADPFNPFEPVDSSAAAIAAQGLMRFGTYLNSQGTDGSPYLSAGLTVLRKLLSEPYLSTDTGHQGLLLHGVYHRPNGWDHAPDNTGVPSGESVMWGDYHLVESALYAQRLARNEPYLTFFGQTEDWSA